jgi:hypothetical protein
VKTALASRWTWRVAALVALGLVFMAYLQPDIVMQLATQLWNCF